MTVLAKVLEILTPAERRTAGALVMLMMGIAMLDVLGVASIIPFTTILANPQIIHTNEILNSVYLALGFTDEAEFVWAVGVASFVLLLSTQIARALGVYAQLRFTFGCEHSIGVRLLGKYLGQPYSWFLLRNSSDLAQSILSEVNQAVLGAILPMLNLISQGAVSVILIGMLFLVDPLLAVGIALILGGGYAVIYSGVTKHLRRIGQESVDANQKRHRAIGEVFGAAKEVKLLGLEGAYLSSFSRYARTYALTQASEKITGQLPRFGLEAVAFGGMMAVLLYLMTNKANIAEVVPVVALYAFAGYRLMPALQQIYVSLASIKFSERILDTLNAELAASRGVYESPQVQSPVKFEKSLVLKSVGFYYADVKSPALWGVTVEIRARESIGIVGPTGSGKSTLIDIILGLLNPSIGQVFVDGLAINQGNLRSWQSIVGYVPQQIYLSDDTVAANIAFGIPHDQIDKNQLMRVAALARLDGVIRRLPSGYDTCVGERGVRLSGGQRQRIGIARALYRQPKIIVFDEATSALDNQTEVEVLDSVKNIRKDVTIIMVAHRLSTVKDCDKIYLLSEGRLEASGSHETLMRNSENYRKLNLKANE